MVFKPSCWGIFFVKAQTKIGPVSQQTLNILTKTKLTTKKTNIFIPYHFREIFLKYIFIILLFYICKDRTFLRNDQIF